MTVTMVVRVAVSAKVQSTEAAMLMVQSLSELNVAGGSSESEGTGITGLLVDREAVSHGLRSVQIKMHKSQCVLDTSCVSFTCCTRGLISQHISKCSAYLNVVDIACFKIMHLSHSVRTIVVSGTCS